MQVGKASWRIACAAFVVCASFAGATSAQQFRLIAGGGDGDGGTLMQASLAGAYDVVYDRAGNLFVSQKDGNRIRRISPEGTITTVVGGNAGFAGDGGPAAYAKISQPAGLAVDSAGNLYFADSGNRRVRRISTTGIITTVAGNGDSAFAGDGGAATAASFRSVDGLAIDASGSLLVSDTEDRRIRKITANGVISTFAGDGFKGSDGDGDPATSARFYAPRGLDVDAAGNLFIADENFSVRVVAPSGIISTLGGYTHSPSNVVVSPAGLAHVTDRCGVRRIDPATGTSVLVAGLLNGTCGNAVSGAKAIATPIGRVEGLAFDPQGRLVLVDTYANRLHRLSDQSLDATLETFAGVGGNIANGRAAVGAPLGAIKSIAKDLAGNLLITDRGYRRVRRLSADGTIDTLGGTGVPGGCPGGVASCAASAHGFESPWGIAPGNVAGQVLVSDPYREKILAIDSNGTLSTYFGPITTWEPFWYYDLLRRPNGDLLVSYNNRVGRYSAGTMYTLAGNGQSDSLGDGGPAYLAAIWGPRAVAVDAAGTTFYLSERWSKRVRRIDPNGVIWRFAGTGSDARSGDGGPAYNAGVGLVTGIAVHGTNVYLAAGTAGLRRVDANGIITTVSFPHHASSLVVDGNTMYVATDEGRIYAATFGRPRKVESDFDGDGKSDLAWRHQVSGGNTAWRSANNTTQLDVTDVTHLTWKIVGQGDFDGDGKSDLAWRNGQTGANTIWRSANNATQMAVVGVNNLAWSVKAVGDFNGDGKSDLVWRNSQNGQNVIWYSANAATQAMLATVPGTAWQIAGVGDFDGDGESDLLWRNAVSGANSLWRSGSSATQLPITGVNNPAWKIQGVGDFDGDGRSDIFWRNTDNGSNTIWRSASNAQQIAVMGVTSQAWRVVAVGDYDGDGKSDLAWRNAQNGANTVWRSGSSSTQTSVLTVPDLRWTIVPDATQP